MNEASKVLAEAKLQVGFLLAFCGLECYLEKGNSVVAILLLDKHKREGVRKGPSKRLVLVDIREVNRWVRGASNLAGPLSCKDAVRPYSGCNPGMYQQACNELLLFSKDLENGTVDLRDGFGSGEDRRRGIRLDGVGFQLRHGI